MDLKSLAPPNERLEILVRNKIGPLNVETGAPFARTKFMSSKTREGMELKNLTNTQNLFSKKKS